MMTHDMLTAKIPPRRKRRAGLLYSECKDQREIKYALKDELRRTENYLFGLFELVCLCPALDHDRKDIVALEELLYTMATGLYTSGWQKLLDADYVTGYALKNAANSAKHLSLLKDSTSEKQ